jgi:hypothetical protein
MPSGSVWSIDESDEGTRLIQSARFIPRGLFGRLYWWSLIPFHIPIFRLMTRLVGILLVAISVDFIIEGLQASFPGLVS